MFYSIYIIDYWTFPPRQVEHIQIIQEIEIRWILDPYLHVLIVQTRTCCRANNV